MLLALAKRLPSAVRYQQRRKWRWKLSGRSSRDRVNFVERAWLCWSGKHWSGSCFDGGALKMNVIGVREHPERGPCGRMSPGYDELDSALARQISWCCGAVTDRTRHLIDARRLQLFKPSTFLINVSRGALVNETALAKHARTANCRSGAGCF